MFKISDHFPPTESRSVFYRRSAFQRWSDRSKCQQTRSSAITMVHSSTVSLKDAEREFQNHRFHRDHPAVRGVVRSGRGESQSGQRRIGSPFHGRRENLSLDSHRSGKISALDRSWNILNNFNISSRIKPKSWYRRVICLWWKTKEYSKVKPVRVLCTWTCSSIRLQAVIFPN